MRRLLATGLPVDLGLLLFFALVAFFGGGIRSAFQCDPRQPLLNVLLQACASGFAGFLVGSVCLNFWSTDHVYATLALVGVDGWVGMILLDLAGDRLMKCWIRSLGSIGGRSLNLSDQRGAGHCQHAGLSSACRLMSLVIGGELSACPTLIRFRNSGVCHSTAFKITPMSQAGRPVFCC